jgi:type I restriction enzyme R subunit
VTTEVVISAPEMRESEDEVDEADDDLVRSFWRKMMERYGGEDGYNKTIIEQFKGPADPDIVIVVDKLLTGFDAPRNTVLYLGRRLKEHALLQAIARVNRVFDEEGAPEKPFGFVIDYNGILKDLADALASYDALQGFSEEDIARSVTAIRDEATKVPAAHAALLDRRLVCVVLTILNLVSKVAYLRKVGQLIDPALVEIGYRGLNQLRKLLEEDRVFVPFLLNRAG